MEDIEEEDPGLISRAIALTNYGVIGPGTPLWKVKRALRSSNRLQRAGAKHDLFKYRHNVDLLRVFREHDESDRELIGELSDIANESKEKMTDRIVAAIGAAYYRMHGMLAARKTRHKEKMLITDPKDRNPFLSNTRFGRGWYVDDRDQLYHNDEVVVSNPGIPPGSLPPPGTYNPGRGKKRKALLVYKGVSKRRKYGKGQVRYANKNTRAKRRNRRLRRRRR